MKRIACFFYGHIWRVEDIFRENEVTMCASKCVRCGKQITSKLTPRIYSKGEHPHAR